MENKKFIDKTIDVFFDKTKLAVLGIFILGFILRIIAARNLGVSPDNASQALTPFGIFNSEKLVIWAQSTALWYYIEGIFYNLFEPTTMISRFTTVLFGSFLIILIYVFVKRIFKSEKTALVSSFLVAVSPMLIKQTLPEMDVAVVFFLVLGALFLFRYCETNSNKYLFLSALIIGIGVMIKLYVLFFAISFIIFLIYKEHKKGAGKRKTLKKALFFVIIVSVLIIPTLAHNYLLYKDKGFMDFIFTNTLKIGVENSAQYYNWDAAWAKKVDYSGFFFGNQIDFEGQPASFLPGFIILLYSLFLGDPIILILGFIGLIFSFRKNKEYFYFFIITFLIAFIYLGANIPLEKHFSWVYVLLIPLASEVIIKAERKIKLKHLILLIFIFNLVYLGSSYMGRPFYGESAFGKLVDFRGEIPNDALVVADSRIFRGSIQWAFVGKNYVESSLFFDIANKLNEQGNLQNVEVYYIECVIDDCGWGTIKSQPEFNESMEKITEFFANASISKIDFEGPPADKYYLPVIGKKQVEYRVYKTNLALNPLILEAVKQTHTRFLLPEGYDRTIHPIFDDFEVRGILDNLLYKFAWFILYLEIVLSFIALFYAIKIFIEE